jgi:hypothetical protein
MQMTFRSSPRVVLVVIAGLFILPLALAWLMYTGTIDYQPGSTRNRGQLVQPPLALTWTGVYVDGVPDQPAADEFPGHWLVLHAVPPVCADACRRDIVNLRQVHRAAGRQQSRIKLALLHDFGEAGLAEGLRDIYTSFLVLENPDGSLWDTLGAVAGRTDPNAPSRGSTYLIDPLGNIMMFYAAGHDPSDLKNDLKRLLTWSKLDEQS